MKCDISIITIGYKSIEDLANTMESVRAQKTKPLEHIFVLSGFDSNKLAIATKTYAPCAVKFVLNRDNSIYNAMNIGLAEASGGCVIFLNSGDYLDGPDALSMVCESRNIYKNKCLAFRTRQVDTLSGRSFLRPGYLNEKNINDQWGHQGFVVPLNSMTPKFDENQTIHADVSWMRTSCKLFGCVKSKSVLTAFVLGGLSNTPSLSSVGIRVRTKSTMSAFKELIKLAAFKIVGRERYYLLQSIKNKYEVIEPNG